MKTTVISNEFTGYKHVIRHQGKFPAVSTVKRHLRSAKASDCKSHTRIFQGDVPLELVDLGNGLRFVVVQ